MYRMHEAVMHYGEAIKAIINEECGACELQRQVLTLWAEAYTCECICTFQKLNLKELIRFVFWHC